jgi:hypothetical protein
VALQKNISLFLEKKYKKRGAFFQQTRFLHSKKVPLNNQIAHFLLSRFILAIKIAFLFFNKMLFLPFAGEQNCRTFVSSIRNNNATRENDGDD